MKRLSHSDWAALSAALPMLYSQRNLDDLARTWARSMKQLVAADFIGCSEFHRPNPVPVRSFTDPHDPEIDKLAPLAVELFAKIPELNFSPLQRYDAICVPVTSRMAQRKFERTDAFNFFHRPLGLQYHVGGMMSESPRLGFGFIINRHARDFSQRDTEVLLHLGKHYVAAVRNAREFNNLSQENSSLLHANKSDGRGVVFLTMDNHLRWMTQLARELLETFFPQWRNKSHLPEELARWLREQRAKLAENRAVASPVEPFAVSRAQEQLSVYLVTSPVAPPMLVLKEKSAELSPAMLQQFGLTPRETEVLHWLIQGKTNGEISILLGAREGTIRKHVERILAHFGTPNRTATVLQVMEQLRSNGIT